MENKNTEASQDELYESIKVVHPGVVVVIIALSMILTAGVLWGIFGRIPVTETVPGFVTVLYPDEEIDEDGNEFHQEPGELTCICCLDATKISREMLADLEDQVNISLFGGDELKGEISYISSIALDRDDLGRFYLDHDWLVKECVPTNYSWLVGISADDLDYWENSLVDVTLVLGEVSPISLIMK